MRHTLFFLLAALGCSKAQPAPPLPKFGAEATLLGELLTLWALRDMDTVTSAPVDGGPPRVGPGGRSTFRSLVIYHLLEDDRPPAPETGSLAQLIEQYRELNRRPTRLVEPPVAFGFPTVLTTKAPTPGDRRVYLSFPAITAGGDSALVRITEICGGLCGHGILALMVRRDGAWRIASILETEFS